LLDASNMLVCGEDLGLVPACAAGVLRSLGILGLRVQRMPARGEGVAAAAAEFGDPALYPYLSVASPSTHDMPPLRAWWEGNGEGGEGKGEENPQQQRLRERFWFAALGRAGSPPRKCTPDLVSAVVGSHAHSPAMLAVFALQDVLAMSRRAYRGGGSEEKKKSDEDDEDENDGDNDGFSYSRPPPRPAAESINDPSVRRHYWRWRCHASVEEMEKDTEMTGGLRRMLESAGRDVGSGERRRRKGRGRRSERRSSVDEAAAAAVARVSIK
jgi:4-alpha-glucanotransferase